MGQFLVRAGDEVLGRWKDEAKRCGVSFSQFVRDALSVYCEDGAIADRVVVGAEAADVFEPLVGFGLGVVSEELGLVSAVNPIREMTGPGVPLVVGDDTVARIFDRKEGKGTERVPSRPRKSRSQVCEHRVPPSAFCGWCD